MRKKRKTLAVLTGTAALAGTWFYLQWRRPWRQPHYHQLPDRSKLYGHLVSQMPLHRD